MNYSNPANPPYLFCKPDSSSLRFVHSQHSFKIDGAISFRSFNLKADLNLIHKWVNQEYAHEYWQMNGPFSQLFAIYQCMERNPYSHSFVGSLTRPDLSLNPPPKEGDLPPSGGMIVCQFDVYSVAADELHEHIDAKKHDCGFHLLMAPMQQRIPGLTVAVVKSFLDYYFSFQEAARMYAEPDINNAKSILLLERCGFKRIKTVQMSYKMAHVYCLERKDHFAAPGLTP